MALRMAEVGRVCVSEYRLTRAIAASERYFKRVFAYFSNCASAGRDEPSGFTSPESHVPVSPNQR